MTEKYQPLDHRLFGCLKTKSRSFMNFRTASGLLDLFDPDKREFRGELPEPNPVDKKEATAILDMEWNDIDETQIKEAWYESIFKYFPSLEEEDEEELPELSEEIYNEKQEEMNKMFSGIVGQDNSQKHAYLKDFHM